MVDIGKLPHVDPFLFLTEVTMCEKDVFAEGCWNISGEECYLRGHFPSNPVVPGVLIAESLAQLSGLIVFSEGVVDPTSVPMLSNVSIKLLQPVRPPVTIELVSRLARNIKSLYLFDVKASAVGVEVAKGTLVLSSDPGT